MQAVGVQMAKGVQVQAARIYCPQEGADIEDVVLHGEEASPTEFCGELGVGLMLFSSKT